MIYAYDYLNKFNDFIEDNKNKYIYEDLIKLKNFYNSSVFSYVFDLINANNSICNKNTFNIIVFHLFVKKLLKTVDKSNDEYDPNLFYSYSVFILTFLIKEKIINYFDTINGVSTVNILQDVLNLNEYLILQKYKFIT